MGTPIIEPQFDPDLLDFRHIVDMGLAAKRKTMPSPKPAGWRSSSLGYCMRRQFLERAGVPHTKQGDDGQRTLFLGDLIHNGIQRLFVQAGLAIVEEQRLHHEELSLTGHVDLIWGGKIRHELDPAETDGRSPQWVAYLQTFRDKLLDAYGVSLPITGTELKSAHQFSAEKMYKEGPQFHHIMQAASYKMMADEDPLQLPVEVQENGGIDRWQITVIAKSDLRMPQFDITANMVTRAIERVQELNDFWSDGKLPPCTCGITISWEKKYCAYIDPTSGTVTPSCCDPGLIENADDNFWDDVDRVEVVPAKAGVVVTKPE